MTFKERIPYFLIGLFVGTIIVAYIFKEKNTEFNYGPNARVLKNIRIKKRRFSKEALWALKNYRLDTSVVSKILQNGDVDMWNKIKSDTCTQYNIQGEKQLENITITVKNCDSIAIVQEVKVIK